MSTLRFVLREAAVAVSLGACFELVVIGLWLVFVVAGARWVLA